ncbi:CIC11C00000002591 [Sungouiella intermedia]|uniref:CIC11C00000002591 n=1 Tax=Sungouiella intermedia TaxID=45354 RepID=A0A1L0BNK7_9ASCO|nr:CIC11C00000002591 [[Candida] intermedia]
MSTLNNENEFRVTRSRTKGSDNSNTAQESVAKSNDVVVSSSRLYLGDVSRQFGIARPAALPTTRKRPLGESANARLTNSRPEVAKAKDVRPKTAAPLAPLQLIPHRLPQKRQATESSTNLVEKLHHESDEESSTKFKKSKRTDYEWQDLDEEDFDDPLMVSEYVNEIFPYLHELEQKTLPDRNYLFNQTQLKPKMRSILVDWLVEMHQRFRLLPETLFLAINIMDRFMSVEVVQIDKLQLLATGSLFIAAKYEEVFSPSVKNYAYYTDGSYTEDEILQAEKYILTILNFDLGYPNPMNFLRRISKADDYDVQLRTLGKFLLEITIVDHRFIGMLPSLCSAAAMYIARLVLGKDPVWNGNLIHYSGGYRVDDMKECIELIVQYLVSPVEHDEFFKKYATRKFMKASIICRSWAKNFVNDRKDLFDERLLTEKINK